LLKISAKFYSIELKIQDITNWSLDNHILYTGASTPGEEIEPLMNPNFDLPPRAMVTTLDQRR
jgi:hypothetical protein